MSARNSSTTSKTGTGFLGLLTLLFIALKLTGVIAWSWLWVLSPLWIGFLAGLAVIVALIIVAALAGARR